MSFGQSLIVPMLLCGALSLGLFFSARTAEGKPPPHQVLKIAFGVLLLIVTLGLGTCYGIMANLHIGAVH